MKVVRKGGGCLDPKEKTGLVFEESGLEIYISDPDKLQGVIQKVKDAE